MSHEKKPWAVKWEIVRQMPGGKQNYTYEAKSRVDGTRAVLKRLKNHDRAAARARMRVEVVSLDTLANAGLRVPKVLDDHTVDYTDPDEVLYFVMDFVPGATLEDLIGERKRLSLGDSIAVTRSLADVMAAAHERNILHRDLKPDNVIVRDFRSKDIVIVDFGLSFNADESPNVTETDEAVGNRFLSLPESGVGGEDKRDKRSDVTLLVAVLYYCLTGHQPKVLRDHPNSLPPHRRPGRGITDTLGDRLHLRNLEVLFDRGFQFRAEDRGTRGETA